MHPCLWLNLANLDNLVMLDFLDWKVTLVFPASQEKMVYPVFLGYLEPRDNQDSLGNLVKMDYLDSLEKKGLAVLLVYLAYPEPKEMLAVPVNLVIPGQKVNPVVICLDNLAPLVFPDLKEILDSLAFLVLPALKAPLVHLAFRVKKD
jgi:hypothetical protein